MAAVVASVVFGLADWSGATSSAYVVQPGDSLWSIATTHRVTVAQLAAANRMAPGDILLIGRRLYVPSAGDRLTSASVGTSPSGSAAWSFCSDFSSSAGPYGVLPAGLAGTSTYYDLQPLFRHWASHYGLNLALLEAVAWQESGWQQGVVSPTGAVGVGQIEPYTADFISSDLVGQTLDVDSVSDNIRMSAAFLTYLAHVEGNNRCATIAAYYEGPLNLQTVGVLPDARQYVADVEALIARFE